MEYTRFRELADQAVADAKVEMSEGMLKGWLIGVRSDLLWKAPIGVNVLPAAALDDDGNVYFVVKMIHGRTGVVATSHRFLSFAEAFDEARESWNRAWEEFSAPNSAAPAEGASV